MQAGVPVSTTEHTINDAIAAELRETRRQWNSPDVIRSENTGLLKGNSKRPDVVVLEANVSPVVIETEIAPAITVEAEAVSRLGEVIKATGRPILSSIAIRLPGILKTKSGSHLRAAIKATEELEIAIYTGIHPNTAKRWPKAGWLTGSIIDLSILVQSASVPPAVVEQAANDLVSGVSEAAGLISEISSAHPIVMEQIGEHLKQKADEQTCRMAATILVNAFMFHDTLARGPTQRLLCGTKTRLLCSQEVSKGGGSVQFQVTYRTFSADQWEAVWLATEAADAAEGTTAAEAVGEAAKIWAKMYQ